MTTENVVIGKNLVKKYKGFELNVEDLQIPKGFATALIGENGAGKTTLLNLMSGIRKDFTGEMKFFDEQLDCLDDSIRERIGYTAPTNLFLPQWTIKQVEEMTELLFEGFHADRFQELIKELGIPAEAGKKVKELSDGNKMKLMIANVLARDTELLILDEPASPMDPLMRDKLCEMFREYLAEGEGKRSIFFSTHNVADMENVTDYVLLMEKGKIVETGFVEQLKEKYILIKGETEDYDKVKEYIIGGSKSKYGFEGLCLSEDLDKLAGVNVAAETPTLTQICVKIMKEYSSLQSKGEQ